MLNIFKHSKVFITVVATLLPAAVYSQSESADDWESITDERLLNPEPGDWMSYRRSYDVTAFSPLDEINRDNVDDLRMMWSYSMRDGSRWLATPIVANGLMYIGEGSGRILALDVVTGELVWSHTRTFPPDIAVSQANRRFRGVSIYGDTIYWGTADSYIVALDARTGEQRWETRTSDYHNREGHAHPPLIADGKVFTGMTGGDFGARGSLKALDAVTGEILWTFYTVPGGPDDPGGESWDWSSDFTPSGAATWNTLSYDPELNLVYSPTGQPSPWSTTPNGHGDALFANSIIALDADTGELRWYYQMNPRDNWDRATYESMLVDLEIDGEMRKALIQTGKIGWGVVLDRATGEFLHAFRTAYDNTITGWDENGRPIYDPATIPSIEDRDTDKVFQICPHVHGARNLQAPSFSPKTGLYYVGINNSCMNAIVVSPIQHPRFGISGVTYTPSLAPGYDFVGELVAFDPVTGERAWEWRPESGTPITASSLSTAGGVVFAGTADRQFFALDDSNGELLWQTRLSGDVSGAPITFEVDGKQFLAVTSGGLTAPTGTLGRLVDVDVTQGTGTIWVFALPEDKPRQTPRPVRAEVPTISVAEGVYSSAQAEQGAQIFAQQCSMCHAAGDFTGQPMQSKWGTGALSDIFRDISSAMPPQNPGGLEPQQYASIIAYFLRETGYPPSFSQAALPPDSFQLQSIVIDVPGRIYTP